MGAIQSEKQDQPSEADSSLDASNAESPDQPPMRRRMNRRPSLLTATDSFIIARRPRSTEGSIDGDKDSSPSQQYDPVDTSNEPRSLSPQHGPMDQSPHREMSPDGQRGDSLSNSSCYHSACRYCVGQYVHDAIRADTLTSCGTPTSLCTVWKPINPKVRDSRLQARKRLSGSQGLGLSPEELAQLRSTMPDNSDEQDSPKNLLLLPEKIPNSLTGGDADREEERDEKQDGEAAEEASATGGFWNIFRRGKRQGATPPRLKGDSVLLSILYLPLVNSRTPHWSVHNRTVSCMSRTSTPLLAHFLCRHHLSTFSRALFTFLSTTMSACAWKEMGPSKHQ